ncbi:hypothetical protein JCM8547_002808 [Rhodosporidiobolus lusitaniae]
MPDDPASSILPPVHPPPSPTLVLSCLSRLTAFFFPPNVLVDLRLPAPDLCASTSSKPDAVQVDKEEGEEDEFELNYARGWLERVVAIGARKLARGEEGAEEWEMAVDEASGLIAVLSGPSAQGSSSKTYLLPTPLLPVTDPLSPSLPSDAPLPTLSLTIRDTTLLSNSTGFRTWGSSPLLAQRLTSSPSSFFPLLTSSTSSLSESPRRLRVLELGSGTGLVGLAVAAAFSRLVSSRPSQVEDPLVTLSDGGSEPAVLDNLAVNVSANSSTLDNVEVQIRLLDWRDYLPSPEKGKGKEVDEEDKYDVILAADVAYEPGMAEALHAAVAALLRFPSSPPLDEPSVLSSSNLPRETSYHPPAFHLIIPLRRTHTLETAAVSRLFPPPHPPAPLDPSLLHRDPASNRTFRLVSRSLEEVTGPDGFGGGARRGRARPDGEVRYRIFRVEWEEVDTH